MASEDISAPVQELLKRDEYYLFYEMMMHSLKTDNVDEGLNLTLGLLREYLQSGNIVLYKKREDGTYIYKKSDVPMPEEVKTISCIINKTAPLAESKGIFTLDINQEYSIKNMTQINIKGNDAEYILAINNYSKPKTLPIDFWEKLKETFIVIMKRAESYYKNTQAMSIDLLTGLDNRNSYENRINGMDESEKGLVFGIFDLFRLKYVNDNYNHAVGDKYIKEAARIMQKYWPKHRVITNEDGTETYKETGDVVYRVGGDEFVVLTKENIELTKLKAQIANQELQSIDLGIGEQIPIGLNNGIVMHEPGDKIKNTVAAADQIMTEDKKRMYEENGLERRK